jgi:putative thiamine transport system permease protein
MLAPVGLWLLFTAPVTAGLAGTLLPAFGYLPVLGGGKLSLEPWRQLALAPGLGRAVALSLGTGLATTLLAFAAVTAFVAHWFSTPLFGRIRRLLSPLLSVPHVALAIGFAFLVAPSGWIFRLLAGLGLAGPLPPPLPTVHDPFGIALVFALVLKEVPFLLLMTLVAGGQVAVGRTLTLARTLGRSPASAWLSAVLPQLYPQLRLPIYAVIGYSVSVVDVALVLGPSTPPPLAVLCWREFQDPDLTLRFTASAGACLQLALAALAIVLWRIGEAVVVRLGLRHVIAGPAARSRSTGRWPAAGVMAAIIGVCAASLFLILLWSLATQWPFSRPLPERLTLATWGSELPRAGRAIADTVLLAIASAAAAVVLTVALLESEKRQPPRARRHHGWLIYAPLLLPQIGFLFGIQVLLVAAGMDGTWPGVVWTHFLFVLPYVYLSLAEPWRALDPRYERTALCLGRRRIAVFARVTVPMLVHPLLVALALGFAVSVGQYLPTLFAGAGRFATVTTEAVALAAGGDRRVVGTYAALQMLLPALAFAAAQALARLRSGPSAGSP